MKIVKKDKVYVQRNDLMLLSRHLRRLPTWFFDKITQNGPFLCLDCNRFEFMTFTSPEAIEFFKGIDCLLDFDEVKDMSLAELDEAQDRLMNEYNAKAVEYNALAHEERVEKSDLREEIILSGIKVYSLEDFIAYRRKKLNMTFPSDVEVPAMKKPDSALKKFVMRAVDKIKAN